MFGITKTHTINSKAEINKGMIIVVIIFNNYINKIQTVCMFTHLCTRHLIWIVFNTTAIQEEYEKDDICHQ